MKIACFVSRFPHLYQTFVRREIDELRRRGATVDVFPVVGARRRGHREVDEGCRAVGRVFYTPLLSAEILRAACLWAVRKPLRCARVLGLILCDTWRNPAHLSKSMVAFLRGLALASVVRRGGYTHIHAHWATHPATAALVVSELSGVPFSFAFHAYDIFAVRIMIPEKIAAAAFAVVNCRYTLDCIRKLYPAADARKLELIYNGLDLSAYAALRRVPDTLCPTVLAVGQLVARKGFSWLVEACAFLAKEGRKFRLMFVGSGPEQERLADLAQETDIAGMTEFAGEKEEDEVAQILARSSMLVMPCVTPEKGSHDALPNVIMEAQAAGVPVIATDVFAIPEVVRNEVTGLLVPERDAPALKAAIARLLDDPGLGERLATAAREGLTQRFDRRMTGRRLMELFEDSGNETKI